MGGNEVREWFTFGLAVLGAGLGVFNAWKGWIADRVRLRVIPMSSVDTAGDYYISIDVRNLSAFPVTVTTIGFTVVGGVTHMQIPRPILLGADRLPVRLESRAAFTVLAPLTAFEKLQVATIEAAYANTACGLRVLGNSKALGQMVNAALAACHPDPADERLNDGG